MPTQQPPDYLTGILIATIVVLAGVIAFLFRLYVNRNKDTETLLRAKDKEMTEERERLLKERHDLELAQNKERSEWELELEQIRADHEKHLKDRAESYAMELGEMSDKFMAREDAMRKDFGDRIERIAAEASRAAQEQSKVLEKIYDRFVGPRRQGSRF